MADFGSLGGIYDGFLQGQDAQLAIQQKQQAVKAFQDDQDSLALLGNAFGVPVAQPPPPGQASQPRPPQGIPAPPQQPGGPAMAPGVPIGVPAPPPGSSGPQGAMGLYTGPMPSQPPTGVTPMGSMQQQLRGVQGQQGLPAPPPQQQAPQQPQPGVGGLSQGPQPQPSPAPPQQGPQAAGGMLSLDQLTQRIVSAPGNREKIQANPGLLVRALEKGQALLAPEGRQELAQAKQNLASQQLESKMQQFESTLAQKQATQLTTEQRLQIQRELLDAKQQNLKLAQDGLDRRTAQARDARLDALLMTLTERGREADQTEKGRNARAQTMNLGKLTQMATKAGVTIDDTDTPADIQRKTAGAVSEKYANAIMPPEVVAFTGDAALTDPSILSHAFSGKSEATGVNKNAVLAYMAKRASPEVLAQAKVALGEKQAEARSEGAIAGTTAVGAKEIEQFAPLVLEGAKKVNLGNYPTINAWKLYAKERTGDPDVVTYRDNLQALQNAASLVLTRGGRMSDQARKLTQALAEGSMAPAQLKAAIEALRAEAKGTGAAARAATADTVGSIRTPGAAAAPESAPTPDDPLGILK